MILFLQQQYMQPAVVTNPTPATINPVYNGDSLDGLEEEELSFFDIMSRFNVAIEDKS